MSPDQPNGARRSRIALSLTALGVLILILGPLVERWLGSDYVSLSTILGLASLGVSLVIALGAKGVLLGRMTAGLSAVLLAWSGLSYGLFSYEVATSSAEFDDEVASAESSLDTTQLPQSLAIGEVMRYPVIEDGPTVVIGRTALRRDSSRESESLQVFEDTLKTLGMSQTARNDLVSLQSQRLAALGEANWSAYFGFIDLMKIKIARLQNDRVIDAGTARLILMAGNASDCEAYCPPEPPNPDPDETYEIFTWIPSNPTNSHIDCIWYCMPREPEEESPGTTPGGGSGSGTAPQPVVTCIPVLISGHGGQVFSDKGAFKSWRSYMYYVHSTAAPTNSSLPLNNSVWGGAYYGLWYRAGSPKAIATLSIQCLLQGGNCNAFSSLTGQTNVTDSIVTAFTAVNTVPSGSMILSTVTMGGAVDAPSGPTVTLGAAVPVPGFPAPVRVGVSLTWPPATYSVTNSMGTYIWECRAFSERGGAAF